MDRRAWRDAYEHLCDGVLAGFLAYAGLRHALLVLDLGARRLALAVIAAAVGVATGNLAYTTALALAIEWLPRLAPCPRAFDGCRDLVADLACLSGGRHGPWIGSTV